MGITIHYDLKSTTKSADKARKLVEKMRQLAMDLPFHSVSEIVDLTGDECDYNRYTDDGNLRWLCIQARNTVKCPWNKRCSREVLPTRIIAFTVLVGPGCEPVNIGLVQFPSEFELEYKPEDDSKFQTAGSDGWPRFNYRKFDKWAEKTFPGKLYVSSSDVTETRTVKTRLGGWTWGSFCKTEYAAEPACGGVANFLRCHIAVVTLLEKCAELPTLTVRIEDEANYGPSTHSDDWEQARAEGREATYVWHEGKYNVAALIKESGESRERMAAFFGAFKDAMAGTGKECVAPIFQNPTFEQLEFKGSQREDVKPFLEAMAALTRSGVLARTAG